MTRGRTGSAGGAGRGQAPKRVEARYGSWADFLSSQLDVEPGGLFVAGSYDLEVGEDVVAHCTFPGDADGVRLAARVLWRRLRAGSDPSVRPGIGLIVRSASMTAFRRLIEHAEGKAGMAGRREERFPQRLAVECTLGREESIRVPGQISEVSVRGAGLRLSHRPSVGDTMRLHVDDEHVGPADLLATVSWVRGGATGTAVSIGVELEFPRVVDREVWERIVGRARAEARLATEYPSD